MNIEDFKLSCLGSPIDERDINYSEISCADISDLVIPKSFHLKYQFNPKNQGTKGTCVLHSYSECEEIIRLTTEQMSVGFLNALRCEDDFQGVGTIPRQVLKNGLNYGNVYNKDFPINEDYPKIKDIFKQYGQEQLIIKAKEHKSKGYMSLNLEDIKRYLFVEQKPIMIITKVYRNFYDMQYNNGIIPNIPIGDYLGTHQQLILGYDYDILDNLNSWGNIGDKGHTHLDLNSTIIKELWVLTDEKVSKLTKKIGWRVQVSANKLKESAIDDCLKLSKQGIDTYPVLVNGWWKVQCGYFVNIDNRDNMIKKLESLGYKVYLEKVEK